MFYVKFSFIDIEHDPINHVEPEKYIHTLQKQKTLVTFYPTT